MTRNEIALKIAVYRGFAPDLCKLPTLTILGIDRFNNLPIFAKPTTKQRKIFKIRDWFSSFDGLMQVFCEINKGASGSNIVIIMDEIRITKGWDVVKVIEYDTEKPETLIGALQQAIIFYYENK